VIPPELAEYAESPGVYSLWPPGFTRILTERYCLVLGPQPFFTEVMQARLDDAVEETVAEIRRLVSEHGHSKAKWWLGESATPRDLHDRLTALGLQAPEDSVAELVALATVTETSAGPADVDVRRVDSLELHAAAFGVMWDAFDAPVWRREADRRLLEESFRTEQEHGTTVTFVALLDGRAVGSGRAAYCERGGLLFDGSTLPDARGRGAYRALVRARWDEAVRRGVPALVTQAAPASEPILRRLGFEEVCTLRRLEDPL